MSQISINMFRVENCLCFFGLRAGTLFSLYFTTIFYFHGALLVSTKFSKDDLSFLHLLIDGVMIIGIFVSILALLYFPETNKKYSVNSMNAKCIKYFSFFNTVIVVLDFIIFFVYAVIAFHRYGSYNTDSYIGFMFLSVLWAGVYQHFAVVAYSFYLSVLHPENEQFEDMTRNMRTNNTSARNMNDTKLAAPLNTLAFVPNENKNHYSEPPSSNVYAELQ